MKKWTKILCCFMLVGLFCVCTLTGCATVGNIKNSSNELIYNGTSAVMVDGYLYYGNGFADISGFSSDGDYKANVNTSHLSRVNTNGDLNAKSKDFSPKNVEYVSDEVTGYANSFMFVLGDQIYYATPNRQKVSNDDNITNEYTYTCIYRSKVNGDGKKKLYTTTAQISEIEVLKVDKTYYIVMLAGEKLIKINLSNNKSETLAEGVKSVAMPKTYQKDKVGSSLDWNGYVYFTTTRDNTSTSGAAGNVVNRVKLSDGKVDEDLHRAGSDLAFVGREKDVIFFTETNNGTLETYMKDFNLSGDNFANYDARISSTISDVNLIAAKREFTNSNQEVETTVSDLGWIYTAGSNLGFRTVGGRSGNISFNDGTAFSSYKVLLVSGRTIYLASETGIFKADLSEVFNGTTTTVSLETIVTMKSIKNSLYAFDGNYVYYYAQLEEVEPEKDEDGNDIAPEVDENYYLYRAKVSGENEYQLLGLTNINSRRS